ncbi:MAG: PH domain-containing protein [Actinomycetota bacterium]
MADLPPPSVPSSPALDPLEVDRAELREPKRVSPLGPIFLAWAVVRQIGFLNVGIFTALVGSRNFQLVGIGGALLLMVIGVAQWVRFRYSLESVDEGDQLVTMAGVFGRTRTSVPLDRIQSVSTRQNLLHRLFGLVEVNVQTAGSMGAEVQLTAVQPAVADRIRRLSTATKTSGQATVPAVVEDGSIPPPPPDATPILRRSTREVLVVALTRNPLVLLAPIPLGLALGFELGDALSRWTDDVVDGFERIGGSIAAVVVAVLVIVVISVVASITFVVLRLHDLRLFLDGAGLRRLSGLISRTEVTASVERVQVVGVRHNPLERWLGISEVVLPVAGGGTNIQIGNALPSALQLPGSRPDEIERLRDIVLGRDRGDEPGHAAGSGISGLAPRRWTLWGGVVPAAVASIASWWLVSWWALLALAWPPLLAIVTPRWQRAWRWSLGPETLRIGHGVVGRVQRDMPVYKVQNVSVEQGFFHRRHGLADLRVRTASRTQMRIPMLPIGQARALRDELLYRAETDPRPFM